MNCCYFIETLGDKNGLPVVPVRNLITSDVSFINIYVQINILRYNIK
jgi:hypothetical protein